MLTTRSYSSVPHSIAYDTRKKLRPSSKLSQSKARKARELTMGKTKKDSVSRGGNAWLSNFWP